MANKNYILILLLVLSACGSGQESSNDPVWIAAGQSNMAIPESFAALGIRALLPNGERVISNGDFPSVPARFAIELQGQGKNVVIAPVAVRGASLDCWQIDGPCIQGGSSCGSIGPCGGASFLRGRSFEGMLWWQGEAETLDCSGVAAQTYADRLTKSIAAWREYFAAPSLPIYIVQLQRETVTSESCANAVDLWQTIRNAQAEVANTVPFVRLITTTDITYGQDDSHPTYAYPEVAHRLAVEAMKF